MSLDFGGAAIDIPPAWQAAATAAPPGTLMIVGGPDTGKSTFARYLYAQLAARDGAVGFLDGDPGQSTLGPPATITLALSAQPSAAFPPHGAAWRWFLGAVTPRGHMLEMLAGAARLAAAAQSAGAAGVVYDTCGLVDPAQGGANLKRNEVDLLQPEAVFALQHGRELESLLIPWRVSRRVRVVDLRPSRAARRREVNARQAYRADQFARYFATARPLALDWRQFGVFPGPRFAPGRLVALEDVDGFTRGLGIVLKGEGSRVSLLTPLADLGAVAALRLGDLRVDRVTGRDEPYMI